MWGRRVGEGGTSSRSGENRRKGKRFAGRKKNELLAEEKKKRLRFGDEKGVSGGDEGKLCTREKRTGGRVQRRKRRQKGSRVTTEEGDQIGDNIVQLCDVVGACKRKAP